MSIDPETKITITWYVDNSILSRVGWWLIKIGWHLNNIRRPEPFHW